MSEIRLINANSLKQDLELSKYIVPNNLNRLLNSEINRCIAAIDNAPTVEIRPQGEWIISQTMDCHSDIVNVYTCPFCRKKFYSNHPFCNCGADMRGGAENDT